MLTFKGNLDYHVKHYLKMGYLFDEDFESYILNNTLVCKNLYFDSCFYSLWHQDHIIFCAYFESQEININLYGVNLNSDFTVSIDKATCTVDCLNKYLQENIICTFTLPSNKDLRRIIWNHYYNRFNKETIEKAKNAGFDDTYEYMRIYDPL